MPLTPWQRLIAKNYGGGDYAHVETLDECHDVGDTLFTFLMIELDPKEECDSWEEAWCRADMAMRQVEEISNLIGRHRP